MDTKGKIEYDVNGLLEKILFTKDVIERFNIKEMVKKNSVLFLFYDKGNNRKIETKIYHCKKEKSLPSMRVFEDTSFALLFNLNEGTLDESSAKFLAEHYYQRLSNPNQQGTLLEYINEIDNTLVSKSKQGYTNKQNNIKNKDEFSYHRPINNNYQNNAQIKYDGDDKFVLLKGSVVRPPKETTKDYAGGFYQRALQNLNDLYADGLVFRIKKPNNENEYKTREDIEFTNPSTIAILISGRSENGWDFFEGLKELKE